MQNKPVRAEDSCTARHRRRRIWKNVVGVLACVVVFCTTYALILPAITMETPACGLAEHTHTTECYAKNTSGTAATAETAASEEETTTLICNLPEHTHTEECAVPPLTEEEQAQVEALTAQIDALPTQEELTETLAAFEDAGDEDGYNAYLEQVVTDTQAAYETYESLTEAQKAKVTNAAKLMELESLWSAQMQEADTAEQTLAEMTGDDAYIRSLEVTSIVDGTEPWDAEDKDGLDTGENNRRVRTFDTIRYNLFYTTVKQDVDNTTKYESARVYFEFLLPVDKDQAIFSTDDMAWLRLDGVTWKYEDELVTVGDTQCQVLHGSYWDKRSGQDVSASSLSRDVTVRVMNMANNATIQPIFSVWMEVNDVGVGYENNIPNSIAYNNNHNCEVHNKSEVARRLPEKVTVTCTPRYDISIKRGNAATSSWKGEFNFTTGNSQALDRDAGKQIGEINGYGIRVMVKGVDAAHGLRGCELPKEGDTLEFDLTLTVAYYKENWNYITSVYIPRIWSADEFLFNQEQRDGRATNNYNVPDHAAPLNRPQENNRQSCADGGTWTFTPGTGYDWDRYLSHRVFHVKVENYTFDPNHLPNSYERGSENVFYDPATIGGQWWNIQQAVFSTGELWVVTPFYNGDGQYITEFTGLPSVDLLSSVYTGWAKVTNKNGEQVYQKDDFYEHLDTSITLQNPGSFNAYVAAVEPSADYNKPLTAGCFDSGNALKDYATPGTYMEMEAWLNNNDAEGDAAAAAYNLMIKFDDACFEPVDKTELGNSGYHGPGYGYKADDWSNYAWWDPLNYDLWDPEGKAKPKEPKLLYGTTKDKTGWEHNGLKPDAKGYDDAMMKATPEDLKWYDSMDELKQDGAVCVAVLMEYHNMANDGTNQSTHSKMNHIHLLVHAKVKKTAEPGYVYAITNYAAAWTKADVKPLVAQMKAKKADAADTGSEEVTLSNLDYLNYTQNYFPSYSPTAENKMSEAENFPKPTHERSWKRCTLNGNDEDDSKLEDGNNGYGTAEKAGAESAGRGGYYYQDNVYVVGYASQVDIQVAQETENHSVRSTYSMDLNQRVADFAVTPYMLRNATDTGAGGETTTLTADLTVTATLPQQLEYITETSVWGGTYTQDRTCYTPGTVTGGQALETKVTKNEDGTTTLTWVLPNVQLSKDLEEPAPIHFSCRIGNSANPAEDVVNNQTLTVQADIYSTLDPGVMHGVEYFNQDTTAIQIVKNTALSIIKRADAGTVDLWTPVGFTMEVYNSAANPYTGWIVDVLPQNGIGQSSYHGAVQVQEFQVKSDIDLTNVTFYYTTKTDIGSATDMTKLDVTDWTPFTLDSSRTWTPTPGEQTAPITAIAYSYTIASKQAIEMHIDLNLPDGEAGDVLHNRLFLDNLFTSDYSQIVSRTLEGLTWNDANGNGIQDEDESRISGVKVELLRLKAGGDASSETDYEPFCYSGTQTPAVVETGQTVDARKNAPAPYADGRYKFTNLPAGTYAVRFTDGSTTKISHLLAAPANRGGDDTIDSDGIAAYSDDRSTLLKTVILGIELPAAKDMKAALYESPYHDSGFYARGHELPATGGSGTAPCTTVGLTVMLLTVVPLLYKWKKRRREEENTTA